MNISITSSNDDHAFIEKLEEEYDAALYEEAYAEYVKDGMNSRPVSELWKELGLEDC